MIWTDKKILERVELGARVGLGLAGVLIVVGIALRAFGFDMWGHWWGFLSGATGVLVAGSCVLGYSIATLKHKHNEWRLEMHEHTQDLLNVWLEYDREEVRDVKLKEFFDREDAYSDAWMLEAQELAVHLRLESKGVL